MYVQYISSLTGIWQEQNAYNAFCIYFKLYLCPSQKIGICFGPSALIKSLFAVSAKIQPKIITSGIVLLILSGRSINIKFPIRFVIYVNIYKDKSQTDYITPSQDSNLWILQCRNQMENHLVPPPQFLLNKLQLNLS